MLVRDLMTREVVSVDREGTLADAAERMLRAGVGCVLVTSDGTPSGIVTETDALTAGRVADRPFSEIPLAKVASSPLITIEPDATVRAAVQRMADEDVKKLPVLEGMDLEGIVTRSDVVMNYHGIVREAHQIDEQREVWESNRLTDGDLAEVLRHSE